MIAKVIRRHTHVLKLRSYDYIKALSFMNLYFRDDPLVRALKVPYNAEYRKVLSLIWLKALKNDLSLKQVYVSEDTPPTIAGISINSPNSPQDSFNSYDRYTRLLTCGPVMNLLSAWSIIEMEPNLNIDRNQRIFEISGICVSPNFRRFGIARRLFLGSIILAKKKEYDYIKVDCTSPHSARICEDLGFTLIWEKRFLSFFGVDSDFVRHNDLVKVYLKNISASAEEEEKVNPEPLKL